MEPSRYDNNISLSLVTLMYLMTFIISSVQSDKSASNHQYQTTAIIPPSAAASSPSTTPQTTTVSSSQHLHCTLGDDTFQIGERWNPNLPPFGVQVCVLCECTIRQRKSCYETKVTCRRITNECPLIDSCPDGSRPVTIAGQCCKSCQSTVSSTSTVATLTSDSQQQQQTQQQSMGISSQSVAYEQANSSTSSQPTAPPPPPPPPSVPFKIIYMNERTKDYLSMVKNFPLCPSRDGSENKQPSMSTITPPKSPKGTSNNNNKNELNGIDTRLAFKSLHDTGPNHLTSTPKHRYEANNNEPIQSTTGVAGGGSANEQRPGQPEQDHQHPNDVQSAAGGMNSNNHNNLKSTPTSNTNQSRTATGRVGANNQQEQQQQQQHLQATHTCKLGNETFQVGDVWNPVLPPFGVQVCVLCNCHFRVRKGCFETRVTCKRINKDCPIIETCPDGSPPVTLADHCCKSCPQSSMEQQQQQWSQVRHSNNSTQTTFTMPISQDNPLRIDNVSREFQSISRTMPACASKRAGIDLHNNNNNNTANRSSSSPTRSKRFHR